MPSKYEKLSELYFHEYNPNFLIDLNPNEEQYDPQFAINYEEDDYEKKRRKIFKELCAAILTSKCPRCDSTVAVKAWNIQEYAAASADFNNRPNRSIRLKLDLNYYVYVLLDTRKPGRFVYRIGDKTIIFKFQPFYVGKGKNDRLKQHANTARKKKCRRLELSVKEQTILDIEKSGRKVIEKIISTKTIEAVAFAKEILLISEIGRLDLGLGPLTNLTDGGGGTYNMSLASKKKWARRRRKTIDALTDEERKELLGTGSRKWWSSLTKDEYLAQNRKTGDAISKDIASWSPEKKELVSANRSKSHKSRWENMTPKEREAERKQKRKDLQNHPVQKCPHCGFAGSGPNMGKWHFDRCKHNPNLSEEVKADRDPNSEKNRLANEKKSASLLKTAASKPLKTCPHCRQQGRHHNFIRNHFDNCKHQ